MANAVTISATQKALNGVMPLTVYVAGFGITGPAVFASPSPASAFKNA